MSRPGTRRNVGQRLRKPARPRIRNQSAVRSGGRGRATKWSWTSFVQTGVRFRGRGDQGRAACTTPPPFWHRADSGCGVAGFRRRWPDISRGSRARHLGGDAGARPPIQPHGEPAWTTSSTPGTILSQLADGTFRLRLQHHHPPAQWSGLCAPLHRGVCARRRARRRDPRSRSRPSANAARRQAAAVHALARYPAQADHPRPPDEVRTPTR